MSISEGARQVLRDVGLNAYEIDVYKALLEGGQITAMEISKKANVPYSKIYEVLNSLKDKGWIRSVDARPTKYYPIPPLEALAVAKTRVEDKYANWEQTVAGELQPLYEKRELVERPDILILHGQQGVLAKLEETLKKATKEIVIAAPEFAKTIFAAVPSFLEVLQKTRVNIKLMVAGKPEEWANLRRAIGIGELRARDQMFGGGVIVDGREAILVLGEEKPSLVIWSNHASLVRFAREYFQFLWDSSKKT
ncbi:TrmB family transcriptional regulator [Candidatus Bathyarchaeota archaeon]|nr:TrmB family transcriptional regulator [Candidatus Bathyarchaeota archaeon]